ncbi:MAG: hypothetical protein U0869_00895 [Chloroflexota bacterium]
MRTLRSTLARSLVVAAMASVALGSIAQAGTPTTLKDPGRIASGDLDQISMAVDSAGKVHIAALRPTGNLVYLTDRTGSWTERVVAHNHIPGGVGFIWQEPSLALDENDRVTIAAVKTDWGGTGCDCTAGIFSFSDKGRARGTFPSTGTKRVGSGTHAPSLKTANGHLYLAYRSGATNPEQPAKIRFKTNATGTWTDTVVKSFAYDPAAPALRIGDDGKARIAFDTATGIWFATAGSLSGAWSVEKVPSTSGRDAGVALSLASTGKPAIAWVRSGSATDGIRYATKPAATWTTQLVTGHVGQVALSLDASNRPFLAVADDAGADAGLWTYAGDTFIEDELYGPKAWSPQVRIAGSGIVSLAFVSPVAPKGLYLSQD